jgi:hypothetical protein
LEASKNVICYARNDRLELNIPYELYGNSQFYQPDFVVRLLNGITLILEVKGQVRDDTDSKHQGAKRWVSAVNNWGKLGRWDFHVCKDPQMLGKELEWLVINQSTFKEHEIVQLNIDLPNNSLQKDAIGTVVFIYRDRNTYEVEFATKDGSKVITLSSLHIRRKNSA